MVGERLQPHRPCAGERVIGYANHSAVSKRLAQIRKAAESYFDQC